MATNTRGGNRSENSRSGSKGSRNNNPAGHNQYDRGLIDSARDRPFTAAAAIGGAVAAGVFLWSKRNQISDQISGLSEQLADWRDGMMSDSGSEFGATGDEGFIARSSRGSRKSQSDIAEEALTLKDTGKKTSRPTADPTAEQSKVGSVAY